MTRRYPDWPKRLDEFIQLNSHRHFQWGEWDCGSFVAQAILSMTGIDMESEFHGKHSDESSARQLGSAESIAARTAQKWNLPHCSPNYARPGDPVLIDNLPIGPCMGIVGLRGTPLKVTPNGIVSVERKDILRAWHLD